MMHALIIEDEPLIAEIIEDVLSDAGYTSFDHALTEQDAVEFAKARKPDLITADVMLNPGSGVEAVKAIKEQIDVPVVFVTSTPETTRVLPGACVVRKPFTAEHLKRGLQKCSGRA